MGTPRSVVLFDFDDTLVVGDSLWPFLVGVGGCWRAGTALIYALGLWGLASIKGVDVADARTFVKEHLLRRVLAGVRVQDLTPALFRVRDWMTPRESVLRALRDHHHRGAAIVIASGGLDLYLPFLLRDIPYDALICSEMTVENGCVTGSMAQGNCVRARKAARVAEWLAAHGPFGESWAYGNYPHDVPMMNLAKHRIIVS